MSKPRTAPRFVRNKNVQTRCKPTLRQLYFILLSSVVFIVCCLYVLNERTSKHFSLFGSINDEFNSDYLILPKTLPVAARLLTVLVFLSSSKIESRIAIRNSWASTRHKYNVSVFFILGRPDKSAKKLTINNDKNVEDAANFFKDEANFFNDIIQTNIDEIENDEIKKLTLALRFVESNLLTSFVMKVDEDCFVNLPEITKYLTSISTETSFITSPQSLSWANSSLNAPFTQKPSVYIMNFNILQKLIICLSLPHAKHEGEAHIMIECFHKFGILRKSSSKFLLNVNRVSLCAIKNNFVVHPVNFKDMETFWLDLVQNKLSC